MTVHPLAWWVWALGLAVASSRTTNPLVLGLILAGTVMVVAACRHDTPWARAFPAYLVLGSVIVVVRVLFYVLVGVKTPGPVLVDLPRIGLPQWAAAIDLLGPVTLTGLLMAVYAGLKLATLVVCFGAANALANPGRALRALPPALHQVATAVVIAISVTPQLVGSARAVRRAQRLRGHQPRGIGGVVSTAVPVLTDALDRSLSLAASMDSRGYARTTGRRADRRVAVLLPVALVAGALGLYGLLDGTTPAWMGVPLLLAGAVAAVVASVLAGRQVRRTRYRPDRWRGRESWVAGSGLLVAGIFVVISVVDPAVLAHSPVPPGAPPLPPVAIVATGLAVLPVLPALRELLRPAPVRQGVPA